MKMLVLGGGAREHALAARLAAEPGVDRRLRSGQSGHRPARCPYYRSSPPIRRPCWRWRRRGARTWSSSAPRHRWPPASPTGSWRPEFRCSGRPGRRRCSKPASRLRRRSWNAPACRRPGRASATPPTMPWPRSRPAQLGWPLVVKADGLAGGKGVVIAADRRRRRGRGPCGDGRRGLRRRRDTGRARGVPGRRGAVVLRHRRRRALRRLRLRTGSQAAARRRPWPQHRRDGRVRAQRAADRDAGGADRARDRPADADGDGRGGHAVPRVPLLRADAHRCRPEGDRVQLPLRRSRSAGRAARCWTSRCRRCCGRPAPAPRCRSGRASPAMSPRAWSWRRPATPATSPAATPSAASIGSRPIARRAQVRFAGVAERDGALVTAGGRVLTVVGRAATYRAAIEAAYDAASRLSFEGMQLRTDIGQRALAVRA